MMRNQADPIAKIEVVCGDITQEETEAIVNAANRSLLGGGGVDGAIHRAAGPGLLTECRALGGCPPGQARITQGYRLKAKWVIHTVGPIWQGGTNGEDETLAACYRNTLALAVARGIRSISFPAISTGAFGFPAHRAARISTKEVREFLSDCPRIDRVRFVCFDPDCLEHYRQALAGGFEFHPPHH
jgi:O-acetyl-ADP-ribose deacetylase (regulator of RNase III)